MPARKAPVATSTTVTLDQEEPMKRVPTKAAQNHKLSGSQDGIEVTTKPPAGRNGDLSTAQHTNNGSIEHNGLNGHITPSESDSLSHPSPHTEKTRSPTSDRHTTDPGAAAAFGDDKEPIQTPELSARPNSPSNGLDPSRHSQESTDRSTPCSTPTSKLASSDSVSHLHKQQSSSTEGTDSVTTSVSSEQQQAQQQQQQKQLLVQTQPVEPTTQKQAPEPPKAQQSQKQQHHTEPAQNTHLRQQGSSHQIVQYRLAHPSQQSAQHRAPQPQSSPQQHLLRHGVNRDSDRDAMRLANRKKAQQTAVQIAYPLHTVSPQPRGIPVRPPPAHPGVMTVNMPGKVSLPVPAVPPTVYPPYYAPGAMMAPPPPMVMLPRGPEGVLVPMPPGVVMINQGAPGATARPAMPMQMAVRHAQRLLPPGSVDEVREAYSRLQVQPPAVPTAPPAPPQSHATHATHAIHHPITLAAPAPPTLLHPPPMYHHAIPAPMAPPHVPQPPVQSLYRQPALTYMPPSGPPLNLPAPQATDPRRVAYRPTPTPTPTPQPAQRTTDFNALQSASAALASSAMGFFHTQQQMLPTPIGLHVRAQLMKMNAQEAQEYLAAMAVQHIEWHLSPQNLVHDIYLRSQLDEEGWLPLAIACNIPTVATFVADYYEISKLMRESLILDHDVVNETIRLKENAKAYRLVTSTGALGLPRWLKTGNSPHQYPHASTGFSTMPPHVPQQAIHQSTPGPSVPVPRASVPQHNFYPRPYARPQLRYQPRIPAPRGPVRTPPFGAQKAGRGAGESRYSPVAGKERSKGRGPAGAPSPSRAGGQGWESRKPETAKSPARHTATPASSSVPPAEKVGKEQRAEGGEESK